MFNTCVRPRPRAERGMATLDVLLGMAIFGLIIVIGVQNWNTLRHRAIVQSVTSDAKGVAEKIQLIGGADGSGPDAAGPRMKSSDGGLMLASFSKAKAGSVKTDVQMNRLADVWDPVEEYDLILTKGNRLVMWATNSPHFGYCIERDPNGPWAAYRTDLGGIYAQGENGGCKTLDPDVADPDMWTLPQDGEGPEHGPVPIPGTEDETEDTDPEDTDETVGPTPTPSPSESPTTPVPTTPVPTTPVPTTPVPTTPVPTTPVPTTPVPTTPVPTATPPLWTPPTSAAAIEKMCQKAWPKMIYGNGAIVYGTAGNDIIFAGNGGQIVYGLGGDDLICGGNGKDTLYGGAGSDVLYGGNGKDILYGGSGRDFLHGNNGKDTMYVGDGYQDMAYGGNGADVYLEDGPDNPDNDQFQQGGPNAA